MHNQNSCDHHFGRSENALQTSQRQLLEQKSRMHPLRSLRNLCGVASVLLVLLSSARSQNVSKLEADSTSAILPKSGDTSIKHADKEFVIGPEDLLAINVWKEPDISRSIPVRSDGKITLPLIGELQASGRTPNELQQQIAGKLQSYISEPEVTVIVQEIRSQRFNILGQVAKPGSYQLANASTVLDAIAVAGGFRDFAKKKSIYVLRQGSNGKQDRLPFNYTEVIKGKNPEQNAQLKPRDTIVVP
jgi:polysaccharide biosynthesis/export protein